MGEVERRSSMCIDYSAERARASCGWAVGGARARRATNAQIVRPRASACSHSKSFTGNSPIPFTSFCFVTPPGLDA